MCDAECYIYSLSVQQSLPECAGLKFQVLILCPVRKTHKKLHLNNCYLRAIDLNGLVSRKDNMPIWISSFPKPQVCVLCTTIKVQLLIGKAIRNFSLSHSIIFLPGETKNDDLKYFIDYRIDSNCNTVSNKCPPKDLSIS